MNEEWKPVHDFEGYYEISNNGVIRSIEREVNCASGKRILKSRIMQHHMSSHGYWYVRLSKLRTNKACRVHRLLAIAFLPNPDNKPEVNHKNSVRSDFRLENLEWATGSDNIKHSFISGESRKRLKKVAAIDNEGKRTEYDSMISASRSTGIPSSNIRHSIIGRHGRTHAGGLKWSYA